MIALTPHAQPAVAAQTKGSHPAHFPGGEAHTQTCPTPTKRRFSAATVYRVALRVSGIYGKPIRPYPCLTHWHLSSIPHPKDWT